MNKHPKLELTWIGKGNPPRRQPPTHHKKRPKQRNVYLLEDGMVFEKTHYGRKVRLCVARNHDVLEFKIDGKRFQTLTAAARYVCGDETRQLSGPLFWNVPVSKARRSK